MRLLLDDLGAVAIWQWGHRRRLREMGTSVQIMQALCRRRRRWCVSRENLTIAVVVTLRRSIRPTTGPAPVKIGLDHRIVGCAESDFCRCPMGGLTLPVQGCCRRRVDSGQYGPELRRLDWEAAGCGRCFANTV